VKATASQSVGQEEQVTYRALQTPIDGFIRGIANKVGGKRAKEVERFLKFAIVGSIGAVVDLGTLNILQSTVLPPVEAINVAIAVTISFTAAIMSNFFWNRYWTYPDSRSRSIRRQLTQFAFVSTVGWLGRTAWITWSFGFIGAAAVGVIQSLDPDFALSLVDQNRLGSNIALLLGILVVMQWNFFVNRFWTYNDVN